VAVRKVGGSGRVIDPSGSLVVAWRGEIYFEKHPRGGRVWAFGGVCHGAAGYARAFESGY
jgi:hypothetical protein